MRDFCEEWGIYTCVDPVRARSLQPTIRVESQPQICITRLRFLPFQIRSGLSDQSDG
ncbi:hypothetical protein A2U01_0109582, partial [Trifolium medium]|nr:hypothetical protein [Trifolium medium]